MFGYITKIYKKYVTSSWSDLHLNRSTFLTNVPNERHFCFLLLISEKTRWVSFQEVNILAEKAHPRSGGKEIPDKHLGRFRHRKV